MDHSTRYILWFVAFLIGLPLFSENVYAPSLPHLAADFSVSAGSAEHTLSIYLAAFCLGTLCWGYFSDLKGRRKALFYGWILYLVGVVLCLTAPSISFFMVGRFVQGIGASAGSVIGRAIVTDVFSRADRGKAMSTIGLSISFSPVLGPIIGSFLGVYCGWRSTFILLFALGALMIFLIQYRFSETKKTALSGYAIFWQVVKQAARDKNFLSVTFITGCLQGIGFGYYAEGPFYFSELLGFSPLFFGITFAGFALGLTVGSYLSRQYHKRFKERKIIEIGIKNMVFAYAAFCLFIFIGNLWGITSSSYYVPVITLSISLGGVSLAMIMPNVVSISAEGYAHAQGTISSIYGALYFGICAIFVAGMATLHNNSLFTMPVYFLSISLLMLITYHLFLKTDDE